MRNSWLPAAGYRNARPPPPGHYGLPLPRALLTRMRRIVNHLHKLGRGLAGGVAGGGGDDAQELEVGAHPLELQARGRGGGGVLGALAGREPKQLGTTASSQQRCKFLRQAASAAPAWVSSSAAQSLEMAAGRPSGLYTMSFASRES